MSFLVGLKSSILKTVILTAALHTEAALAHGENEIGPNGGEIRMPGPYHTELVVDQKGFHVFLTDISFLSPITENSSVEAFFVQGKKSTKLTCTPQKDHFFCPLSTTSLVGELKIKSVRNGVKGNEASYKVPKK